MFSRFHTVFWLDAALLAVFCALETVPFTGLILHEWLGLAVAAMVVVHLLFSWRWIASATQKMRTGGSSRTRVNYILNLLLFGCVTAVVFSGIRISQVVFPVQGAADYRWESIHDRFSDAIVVLAGLHLAINWNWCVGAARKLFGRVQPELP